MLIRINWGWRDDEIKDLRYLTRLWSEGSEPRTSQSPSPHPTGHPAHTFSLLKKRILAVSHLPACQGSLPDSESASAKAQTSPPASCSGEPSLPATSHFLALSCVFSEMHKTSPFLCEMHASEEKVLPVQLLLFCFELTIMLVKGGLASNIYSLKIMVHDLHRMFHFHNESNKKTLALLNWV